jgi:deaminated glutathione amidase
MVPFAIAGIQIPIVAGTNNIPTMRATLDILMHRFPWVQMVLFSELAAFGPLPLHAQPPDGPVEKQLREMAKAHRLWLVPGSYFERHGDVIHNTALAIDPAGTVIARYHKMFPFQPYEAGVVAGTDFCVFDVPLVGRFGLSICYDMWFPETIRTLAALGAEVILHPTMTDTIDRGVELSIARAMAAVNQCYFFDINGIGGGGVGRSIVVDPSGHVLHQAGSGTEIIPIEIDLDQVRRSRRVGIRGLGQPLKSFRDRQVEFSVYDRTAFDTSYLATLGPLERPGREPA